MTPDQEQKFLTEFLKRCREDGIITPEQEKELVKIGLNDQEKVQRVLRHGRAA